MKQKIELLLRNKQKLTAILPYRNPGDETGAVALYTNGAHTTFPGRRCNWVASHMAGYYSTTLKESSQKSSSILGEGALTKPPLWFHHNLCMIQLKFPVGNSRYNSTIGYVVVQKILIVEECEGGSRIKLCGKCPDIISSQGKRSIEQQRSLARRLIETHYLYKQRMLHELAEADEGPLLAPAPFLGFELMDDEEDDDWD